MTKEKINHGIECIYRDTSYITHLDMVKFLTTFIRNELERINSREDLPLREQFRKRFKGGLSHEDCFVLGRRDTLIGIIDTFIAIAPGLREASLPTDEVIARILKVDKENDDGCLFCDMKNIYKITMELAELEIELVKENANGER